MHSPPPAVSACYTGVEVVHIPEKLEYSLLQASSDGSTQLLRPIIGSNESSCVYKRAIIIAHTLQKIQGNNCDYKRLFKKIAMRLRLIVTALYSGTCK